jgi:hypothetical protein
MAPPSSAVINQLREKQAEVFAELEALSRKHGPEVFRILGQRFFQREREASALKREIAKRQEELDRLQKKAAR